MSITDWPKEDQPREKLLQQGEQSLTDAELIAIFIKTGVRGKTALDIAKELLQQYGSLQQLCQASPSALIQTKGIGKAKYAALKAGIEVGHRYAMARPKIGEKLCNTNLTQAFLAHYLRLQTKEVFACLFLDQHLRLISFEELFQGTIHEATVYPREIIRRALFHNAANLILAHNHPSGEPKPSLADKELTQSIKQTLAYVDVEVVDHIIIGNPEYFSFAEAKLL